MAARGSGGAATLRWLLRSSTLRLTLLLSAIFAAGMALALTVALSLGRDALLERTDQTLESIAASLAADDLPDESLSVIIRPLEELDDLPRPFLRAAREGGGSLFLARDYRGAEDWRALVAEDAEGEEVLIAVPIEETEDALDLLEGVLWSTALAVLVIVLGIGLIAGLLAQRRLQGISRTLDRLAAGDLQARTGTRRASDDLDDLARQLDLTAGELERLVAQTRHLGASIAHDLRTPLARLHARLESLPEGPERAAALTEAAQLSGIFDTVMRIARIEAQQGTDRFAPVDLADLASDLHDTFAPVVEDAGKRLRLDLAHPATLPGDRQMLVQALANLLQNALVHGGPEITLFARGRTIGVSDNGAGVPPEAHAEIVKPMVRLDQARSTAGSGLGLALVRAVADRHGARLHLEPVTPSGLRVALKFADL